MPPKFSVMFACGPKVVSMLALLVWFNHFPLNGCDVCGSSGFSSSLGFLPTLSKHFAGVTWSHGRFQSQHPSVIPGEIIGTSHESYHKTDIRGLWAWRNQWHLMASIPMANLLKNDSGTLTRNTGLSDISCSVQHLILDHNAKGKRHVLMAGAGIKIPTGKSQLLDNTYQIWIPNMQLGTGSYDFLFNVNAIYTDAQNKGYVTEVLAKINTPNRLQYRFGHVWNTSLKGFKKFYFHRNRNSIIPSLGLKNEWLGKDRRPMGITNTLSGGYQLQLQTGVDVFVSKYNISLHYFHPLSYRLSDGFVKPLPSFSVSVTYLL